MSIRSFSNISPEIAKTAYVDEQACVIGDVKIGDYSSIWPMAVIRGDVNKIRIGDKTNVQDGSILHVTHISENENAVDPNGAALILGNGVTIGHGVILHGCEIGDYSLIGMGATIMDHCVIEPYAIVAAGALVPGGKTVKSGELWVGNPARKVKDLPESHKKRLEYSAEHYVKLMQKYK